MGYFRIESYFFIKDNFLTRQSGHKITPWLFVISVMVCPYCGILLLIPIHEYSKKDIQHKGIPSLIPVQNHLYFPVFFRKRGFHLLSAILTLWLNFLWQIGYDQLMVNLQYAKCPRCNKTANGVDKVKELFGIRIVNKKYQYVQSWCKKCRNM